MPKQVMNFELDGSSFIILWSWWLLQTGSSYKRIRLWTWFWWLSNVSKTGPNYRMNFELGLHHVVINPRLVSTIGQLCHISVTAILIYSVWTLKWTGPSYSVGIQPFVTQWSTLSLAYLLNMVICIQGRRPDCGCTDCHLFEGNGRLSDVWRHHMTDCWSRWVLLMYLGIYLLKENRSKCYPN